MYSDIAIAVITLLLCGIIWSVSSCGQAKRQSMPTAAIIDQLSSSYPNQVLTEEITRYLGDYGFQVDYYHGDDVTVDFYRELASLEHNLLIIRSHSGTFNYSGDIERDMMTCLFTTEPYNKWEYIGEQISDQILRASVDEGESVFFAIAPKFITESMKGRFNDTVVIINGCSGLYSLDLAEAFMDKGASAIIAFDESVNLDYSDEVTLFLIENLFSNGLTVAQAVDTSMTEKGPDPDSDAVLRYYPQNIGDSNIGALIQ